MIQLNKHDLMFALRRLPRQLRLLMQESDLRGKVFVGGGFLRSVVCNEKINDVDVFTGDADSAKLFAHLLVRRQFGHLFPKDVAGNPDIAFYKRHIYETENALTLTRFKPVIQFIHRWTFDKPEDIINSFDFTICCAVIFVDGSGNWKGIAHDRFYEDLAARRLVYLAPVRKEEPGGSLLRVLKYYQKGFRMPLDSLAAVIARLVLAVDFQKVGKDEGRVADILTSLLRVVDPLVDLTHEAHLPAESSLTLPEPDNEP